MRFLKGEFAQTVQRTYSIAEIAQALTGGTLETELELETEPKPPALGEHE